MERAIPPFAGCVHQKKRRPRTLAAQHPCAWARSLLPDGPQKQPASAGRFYPGFAGNSGENSPPRVILTDRRCCSAPEPVASRPGSLAVPPAQGQGQRGALPLRAGTSWVCFRARGRSAGRGLGAVHGDRFALDQAGHPIHDGWPFTSSV
jgi:hypothetical protein